MPDEDPHPNIAPKPYLAGRKSREDLLPNKKKKPENLLPASISPRNGTEAIFYQRFGTVTPVPEDTMRRKQNIISAAVLYIHHNKSMTEVAETFDQSLEYLKEVKEVDKWDKFKQQLQQISQPSALSLIEYHDIELINSERDRRLGTVETMLEEERRLMLGLKNMIPGSLQQATALANIEKIRKIVGSAIGLDFHTQEHSAARRTVLSKLAEKSIDPSENANTTKGSILEI